MSKPPNVDSQASLPKRPLSPHKLLAQFDNLPSKKVQQKIEYYFMPYNLDYKFNKFMHFERTNTPYIVEQTMRFLQQPGLELNDRRDV